MFEEAIDTISDREWKDTIAAHLAWGETWYGDLPADVFFGLWASLERLVSCAIDCVVLKFNVTYGKL